MAHEYGISADPGIELAELPLHLFVFCPFNNLPNQTLRNFASSSSLTDIIDIPGHDMNKRSAVRANMDAKQVLRRSYRLLYIIHKAGYTLKGNFTANNFVVDSELSVRLYGIHLSRFDRSDGDKDHDQFIAVILRDVFFREPGIHLSRFDRSDGDKDHDQFIAEILRDVFFREPVPPIIMQWLKLIGRGIAAYEYLICYHVSLMEPYQAVDCFISLYNIFQDLELDDPATFELLISWLDKYDNWQSWKTLFVNDLTSAAFRFRHPKSKQRVSYEDNIRGILKLVRDCLEHPARRFRDRFTLIVNDEFPYLLTDFQEAMFDAGLLQRLHHDTSMS